MKTRYNARRKGMTLAGVMIVIAVIAILAAMMMYSSTEAVATAKATTIIANLQILKRATIAWYVDNRDKVQPDGRVKIGNTTPKPIQEFSDKQLNLASYLSHAGGAVLNVNKTTAKFDENTGNSNTNLKEGSYRICDGGTVKEPDGVGSNGKTKYKTTEYHRNRWYVGYAFQADEGLVREKIKSRMKSAGVFLGTADAHIDTYNDNSAAVWMRVL